MMMMVMMTTLMAMMMVMMIELDLDVGGQKGHILKIFIEIVAGPSCRAGLGLGEHQGGFEAIKCDFLKHVNEENEKNKS